MEPYDDDGFTTFKDYEESSSILRTPERQVTDTTSYNDDDFDFDAYINDTEPVPISSSSIINTSTSNKTADSTENSDEVPVDPDKCQITDSITGKKRPPRQYEFLQLLLEDSRYSSYISWLDKTKGLFKIHQPEQVIALWKKVKCRQTSGDMDYDTFARGVRYYYATGAMIKTNKKHTFCFKQTTNNN